MDKLVGLEKFCGGVTELSRSAEKALALHCRLRRCVWRPQRRKRQSGLKKHS